jgi:ATP-dependent protease Clp ATPase subunit
MTDMMFTIPSRPDIGEVCVTGAFIRGEEEPTYLPKADDVRLALSASDSDTQSVS